VFSSSFSVVVFLIVFYLFIYFTSVSVLALSAWVV
jgi:hypothetical protein